MKVSWMHAGTICKRVMDLHDQSFLMLSVPQAIQATTRTYKLVIKGPIVQVLTESSQIPQAIVNGGDSSTMLRMA